MVYKVWSNQEDDDDDDNKNDSESLGSRSTYMWFRKTVSTKCPHSWYWYIRESTNAHIESEWWIIKTQGTAKEKKIC